MQRLLVIGCGLIGGSVALAAERAFPGLRLVGVDSDAVLGSSAFQQIFAAGVQRADTRALGQAAAESDLTVLASPVRSILELLPELEATGRLLTDCGSTKKDIAEAGAKNPHFVPGHPMAGRPTPGLGSASATLFDGSTWVLCPMASSGALNAVSDFVRALGARPIVVPAVAHDEAVAITSHLPQLLASLLTVAADRGMAREIRGPAFASATRVGGGPVEIWRDIFETNAPAICTALNQFTAELRQIAGALEQGNCTPLLELLAKARTIRDTDR